MKLKKRDLFIQEKERLFFKKIGIYNLTYSYFASTNLKKVVKEILTI
jgi:hypothetical protein